MEKGLVACKNDTAVVAVVVMDYETSSDLFDSDVQEKAPY
jgi:hypothetical protein